MKLDAAVGHKSILEVLRKKRFLFEKDELATAGSIKDRRELATSGSIEDRRASFGRDLLATAGSIPSRTNKQTDKDAKRCKSDMINEQTNRCGVASRCSRNYGMHKNIQTY